MRARYFKFIQIFIIILMFNKSKLNYFSVFCETILLLHVCKKLNNNIECPFFIVSLILINIYVKYFFYVDNFFPYVNENDIFTQIDFSLNFFFFEVCDIHFLCPNRSATLQKLSCIMHVQSLQYKNAVSKTCISLYIFYSDLQVQQARCLIIFDSNHINLLCMQ